MPHINYSQREIVFKLVYYGPGMSGKTTNVMWVHRSLPEGMRSEMLTLDTEQERTLFFDFFPVELGRVEGFRLHFNLYTVPGQVRYEASRRLILQGVDGLVFVADSQNARFEENIASFESMLGNLKSYGIDWQSFPLVLQYNKRDCRDPIPLGTIEKALGLAALPTYEAVAVRGEGVAQTLRRLGREVIHRFQV